MKESIKNNSFCSFNFILYNLLLFKNKNAKIKAVKILSKFTVEYSGSGNKIVEQSPKAGTKLEEQGVVRVMLGN